MADVPLYAAKVTLAQVGIISIAVIAWLACAFKAASIASNNDGNYAFWVVLGLLTGPVGLAIAYLYFRATGERHRTARYSVGGTGDLPEMVSCPSCHQTVPRIYGTCQFCGKPIGRKKR